MPNIEIRPHRSVPIAPSLLTSRTVRRVERKVVENLLVTRGGLISRTSQLDADRQLAGQVLDNVADLTERAVRRTADIAEIAALRPAKDPIEAERRQVLEQTALVLMRDLLALTGAVMAERAFGPGGDSCCRS